MANAAGQLHFKMMKKIISIACVAIMIMSLAACASSKQNNNVTKNTSENKYSFNVTGDSKEQQTTQNSADNKYSFEVTTKAQSEEQEETTKERNTEKVSIKYRFASAAEGVERRYAQKHFFENLTQNDLDYRVMKKGATEEEYKDLIKASIRDFTDEEKTLIDNSIEFIEERFEEIGFVWPIDEEIVFICSNMKEEGETSAFTHAADIYIGSGFMKAIFNAKAPSFYFYQVMAHEIFHVLSRNIPEFRKEMYEIIGFEICEPPAFSDEVRAHIISNPDVEDYDCAAIFTINGKPEKATIVFYAPDFDEKDPQSFIYTTYAAVVPYSDPGKAYVYTEVEDFFDVVGRNTDYVISAEECIADNFSFAVAKGMRNTYESPEIIQKVLDLLEKDWR